MCFSGIAGHTVLCQLVPQYCKALLLGWESPVTDPSVRAQRVSVCWSVAAAVPDSGFALVEADVGMCCEVVG